ncbi:MAG: phosphosugar isomerase [Clostridiaceae bacterium]|jgi:tagatose-6-phosphate ketose/aldose isomerase|nr:phosphosugar isomerase [Clostridiaceae bacterium]
MKILGIEEKQLVKLEAYNTVLEMSRQPQLWMEGLDIIRENKKKIELFIEKINAIEKIKIYLVGAGSSAKAALIVENYIRRICKKEVVAVASTSLITHPDNYILDDSPVMLISLGGSGNTTEGLEAVELFKERCRELYQILIICSPEGKIINKYGYDDKTLYIPIPDKTKGKSIAATGEFTLLIQYALMIFDIKKYDYYVSMFNSIYEDSKCFLEEDIYKVHALSNKKYETIVSLGSNTLNALASEMCLKISELSTGLQSTESHSILEFRHGPKLIMNSNSLVSFFFSNDNCAIKYEIDMLKECFNNKINSTIAAISMDYNKEIDEHSDYYFYFNKNNFRYLDEAHTIFQYSLLLQSFAILNAINIKCELDKINSTGLVNKVAEGVIIYRK